MYDSSDEHLKLQVICDDLKKLMQQLPVCAKIVVKEYVKGSEVEINVFSAKREHEIKDVVKFLSNVNTVKVDTLLDEIQKTLTPEQIQLLKNKL